MNIEGGWTYPKALEVIADLRANGFKECGVTVGGVWVDAPEGDEMVLAIARKHGGGTSYGQTTAMWMVTSGYSPTTDDKECTDTL